MTCVFDLCKMDVTRSIPRISSSSIFTRELRAQVFMGQNMNLNLGMICRTEEQKPLSLHLSLLTYTTHPGFPRLPLKSIAMHKWFLLNVTIKTGKSPNIASIMKFLFVGWFSLLHMDIFFCTKVNVAPSFTGKNDPLSMIGSPKMLHWKRHGHKWFVKE